MIKTFSSKPGLEIIIPTAALLALTSAAVFTNPVSWAGIFILLAVVLFLVYLFISTRYVIKDDTLHVSCGFVYNSTISIKSITKITETTNLLSSPATSIDRLEILYNKYDSVQISPKDKSGFIETIRLINPAVEISLKNDKKSF